MSHQHDHDHDCGHDHDHDHDHDCGEGGIEVAFELIEDALEKHNVMVEDVNDALMAAIDEREAMVERGESPGEIDEMPLLIGGKSYRCGDIFTVTVSEAGEWDDEEEDEEA